MSLSCPSLIDAISPALCAPVDIYCERVTGAWDAEPLNAVSNAGFLLAAGFAWLANRRRPNPGNQLLIGALIAITAIIGLGSFTFHTLATRWAQWVDVVPILFFILVFLWLTLTRFFAWRPARAAVALTLFLAMTLYLESGIPVIVLWGGAMYLPTLIAILAIGLRMRRHRPEAQGAFMAAAGLFVLSFAMRTLDMRICDWVPHGTHFVWHLLNALLLFHLTRTAILYAPERR